MTVDQFLYGTDIEVHAFEKAYYNRTNTQSWLQGLYNYQAQIISLSNAFSSNTEKISYPSEPISLFEQVQQLEEQVDKRKLEEDKDMKFRADMLECY